MSFSALLAKGNSKLGPAIRSFSLPPQTSCPGSTEACRAICYVSKSYRIYPSVRKVYSRNDAMSIEQIESIKAKPGSIVRIHVSGDFKSAEYILAWRRAVKANPDVRFYAYTRCWRVASLRPALEALRSQPNVQLFASIDEQTGLPPAGWRFAMMGTLGGKPAPGSIQCPEQTGRVADCSSCGICFKALKTSITLATH